ncbi:hypothetical protein Hanom_Chr08g00710571 [Helianthus anomalus]
MNVFVFVNSINKWFLNVNEDKRTNIIEHKCTSISERTLIKSTCKYKHSNPEVAGSSLARSQCPYGSGFTPRLRLAGWRSARWDHLGGWEDRGIPPPPPS